MVASLVLLAALAPRLSGLSQAIQPPRVGDEPLDVWDVLGGELRATLAAVTLLQVEKIRHRGVYYQSGEDSAPSHPHSEEAELVQSLRPADMARPEAEHWKVHSHYQGLYTHIHAYGARKHMHNLEAEHFHEHPEQHLSHSHRTDPDIPHWHDEGEWLLSVEHAHGSLVHTHRLGLWPHTHRGMEAMPFALLHDEDRARLAAMETRTASDVPENAFSIVSAVQPEQAPEHDHEHHAEHGVHEELECTHGDTLVLHKERDWRGVFGDLEREIQPYSTDHAHPDATGALSTLPWYRIGVAIDPHFIEGWKLGAAALRRDYGRVDEAIAFIEEGLEKNPGNPELLMLLARAHLFGRRDSATARRTLEEAARSAEAGLAAQSYANRFEAERWKTAWLDSLRLLTTLDAREGRPDEALATARLGLARFPDDPVLQELLDELLLSTSSNPGLDAVR
ncbi:hypothetical protein HS125_19885 [bacterium]|nr:hypothetical protein [bacterium]